MSEHNEIQTWEDIIILAPWVHNMNRFSLDTWNPVETMARERENHFDICPTLGFYPTIMVSKSCFHSAALPTPMVGKEKARDWEKSKESENNQLARRAVVKYTGEVQKMAKDGERSE